jgi:hypothetical protein
MTCAPAHRRRMAFHFYACSKAALLSPSKSSASSIMASLLSISCTLEPGSRPSFCQSANVSIGHDGAPLPARGQHMQASGHPCDATDQFPPLHASQRRGRHMSGADSRQATKYRHDQGLDVTTSTVSTVVPSRSQIQRPEFNTTEFRNSRV